MSIYLTLVVSSTDEARSVLAETKAFEAAMLHVERMLPSGELRGQVKVLLSPRVPADAPEYRHPGWLEWLLCYEFYTSGKLTVGMIQRTPEHSFEFHS